MKKLLCFVVCLFLLQGSAVAEIDADYFCGTWFNARQLSDNYFSYTLLHLFSDGTCYYSSRIIEDNEIDGNADRLLTWEVIDNGVRVYFANGHMDYYLKDDGRLSDGQKSIPDIFEKVFPAEYVRRSDAPKTIPGNLEDGFLLYPGQYSIGVDIPSGDYRFEYYEAPVDIFIRKDPDSAMWSGFASVTKNSPIFAKINLPDGGRLDVGAFPVIIMYAKPLNIGE